MLFTLQTLIDGLESCGLLWCFYQLFGLSFWRHPFTTSAHSIQLSTLLIHKGFTDYCVSIIFYNSCLFGFLSNASSWIWVTYELRFNHSVYNYDMFDYAWAEICWSLFRNKTGLYDFLCLTGLLSWGCLDMKFSNFKWPKRLIRNQLPLWEWFNANDIHKNVFNC